MFQPSQAFDARALVTPYLGGTAIDDNQRLYSGYNTINGLKNKYCSKALSYLEDGEAIQKGIQWHALQDDARCGSCL